MYRFTPDEIKKYFDTECEYYMPFIGFKLDGEPFCKKKHFLLNKGDCRKCKKKNKERCTKNE